MGFEVIDRQPGGCTGQIGIGQIGEASEIWTLIADNYNYTSEDVRISGIFPEVYTSFHGQNPRLRMMPIEVDQDADNPAKFTCTLKWTSDKVEPPEKEDDPLDRKPKVTVETNFAKETTHRDFYGKPKVNTAGDLFDPPIECNVAIRVIKIRKNVTAFPDWVFDFADAVNSSPFTIKNRVIDTGCAWLSYVGLGEIDETGPIPFCEATIEMHIKKRRKPGVGESLGAVPDPWQTEVLNEGLCEQIEIAPTIPPVMERRRIYVKDDTGAMVPAPSPVPLDVLGKVLDPVTIDNPVFVVFRDHEELDFNAISYLWSNA